MKGRIVSHLFVFNNVFFFLVVMQVSFITVNLVVEKLIDSKKVAEDSKKCALYRLCRGRHLASGLCYRCLFQLARSCDLSDYGRGFCYSVWYFHLQKTSARILAIDDPDRSASSHQRTARRCSPRR